MRRQLSTLLGLLCVSAGTAGCLDSTGSTPADGYAEGIRAINAAYDAVPLVALSDLHSLEQEGDFYVRLVQDRTFQRTVNDIVIEFGNALYQPILDRYIAGEAVPMDSVKLVWRNTTVSPVQTWDAPTYARLLRAVRDANRSLPASRRLRVLAGDPPLDWGKVQGINDILGPSLPPRDTHYADVVEREVLARGRKGLLIAGGTHFTKRDFTPPPPPGFPWRVGNVYKLVTEKRPGSIRVFGPYGGFNDSTAVYEPRLAGLKPGTPIALDTSFVGGLDGSLLMPSLIGPDGKPFNPFAGIKGRELGDVMLYFGRVADLRLSEATTEICQEQSYLTELDRRHRLLFGRALDRTMFCTPRGPWYFPRMQ